MTGVVEKTYGDALFTLVCEENEKMLPEVLSELEAVNALFTENPDYLKLMSAPTIDCGEKLEMIKTAFGGRVSDYVFNFLSLLAEKDRIDRFDGIFRHYLSLYNEKFNIAEITVITTSPLTEEQCKKITDRMESITGKNITLTTKIDKSIIGGIVINYGNTRYDGSVKARLEALKTDIGSIIA